MWWLFDVTIQCVSYRKIKLEAPRFLRGINYLCTAVTLGSAWFHEVRKHNRLYDAPSSHVNPYGNPNVPSQG